MNLTTKCLAVSVPTLILAGGCEQAAPAALPPPPTVTVATPVQADAPTYLEVTGTTKAIESVEIRARVAGFLLEQRFEDASEVEAGQVLFVIDPASYQAALDRARSELATRMAERDQAAWDLERMTSLVERGAANEKEYQDRKTAAALAEAAVMGAQAAVTAAELDLGYTEVRSPIGGRVGRALVDEGNLVGSGENTLLTTVVQMDPMYVYFNISERVLMETLAERDREQRRRPERAFSVGLANEKGYPHRGVLDYVDNTVDPTTGTLRVRGTVPNDDELLFPGAFVRVRIPKEVQENALLVHERALGTDLGGKYLLVVGKDDVVEQRPVEIGALVDGMRVIEQGLAPGERYIVDGLQRARPGLPVTPQS